MSIELSVNVIGKFWAQSDEAVDYLKTLKILVSAFRAPIVYYLT